MSSIKFQILPVEKSDLVEVYTVFFSSMSKSNWVFDMLFPPWLQEPAVCRPKPGQPASWPPNDEVIRDRATRKSAVVAETFDDEVGVEGIRYLKACLVGGEGDGKIVGMAKWIPGGKWGAEEEDEDSKEPDSEAKKNLKAIEAEDWDSGWDAKTRLLRNKVLPYKGAAWELDHLFILPDYQNKGLGTAFVKEGLSYIDQDHKPCFLESAPDAVGFYMHLGFEHVGEFSIKGWKRGVERKGEEMDTFVLNCLVKW